MLEILHFVFSSFWIWLGSAVLLLIAVNGVMQLAQMIVLAFGKGKGRG